MDMIIFGRMYFTDDYGYKNFSVFTPMLSSIIFYSNKKVTNWILTRISSEKIKPFDTYFKPTICNLANGRVILKFNNSFFVHKSSSSLYSNFILKLYIVYELNIGCIILATILQKQIVSLV